MYGLAAISESNGWAITWAGLFIVLFGMTTLSLLISQLHKVLYVWENKDNIIKNYRARKQRQEEKAQAIEAIISNVTPDLKESARQFGILVESMDEHFSLPRLLESAQLLCLTRPHSTIVDLIQSDLIVPDGKGFYTWNQKAYDLIMKTV